MLKREPTALQDTIVLRRMYLTFSRIVLYCTVKLMRSTHGIILQLFFTPLSLQYSMHSHRVRLYGHLALFWSQYIQISKNVTYHYFAPGHSNILLNAPATSSPDLCFSIRIKPYAIGTLKNAQRFKIY